MATLPKFIMRLLIAVLMLPLTHPGDGYAQQQTPAITIAPIILVEPMVETPIPIQLTAAVTLPRTSYLRVKGLPAQTTLSDGHYVSPGTWALPISGLADLKLTVPLATTGRTELQVTLLSIEGTVLAEARATLAVTPGQIGSIGAAKPAAAPISQLPATAALTPEPPASASPPPALVKPPTPAPPRAMPPALKPEDQDRAAKLLKRGDAEFAGGDVAGARLLYQRAAEIGLGEAALALGSTYDPAELARRGVKGLQGEVETARKWYLKAQELGVGGAAERLSRLGR